MGVSRAQLKELKEAPWGSVDQLRRFVAEVGVASKRDVSKMLEVLLDRQVERFGPHHKNRCSAFRSILLQSIDPSLFTPLAEAIAPADPMLRAVLLAVLPKVNDPNAHGPLCVALGSNDGRVREAARELLSELAGPKALDELARLTREPAFAGRREALDVMVPRARHRAIPLVNAVLAAGTGPERVHALGFLGDGALMSGDVEAAIEAIVGTLADRDRRVAEAAFQAFSALVDEGRFLDALAPRVEADDVSPVLVEALGLVSSERSVELLEARLRRGPTEVQLAIVRALTRIGGDAVVVPLVDALHLPEGPVQRAASDALLALGEAGEVDLARLLVALLRSPLPQVRRTASQIASTVRTPSAELTQLLLAALRDEDWWVRERVLDALVEMQVPELARHLLDYFDDDSPVIRRYAIFGLLRLRDPATLGAMLTHAVTDPDWWVREQSVQAVGELADARAIPYLSAVVKERADLRVAALEALMTMGADDALLALADLTADEDPAVRLTMLEILGRLERGREAGFYVQACVEDAEPRIAKVARQLVDRWQLARADESASVGLLDRLLVAASRKEADDVLLAPGRSPYVKHLGQVLPISKGVLSAEEMERMILPVLTSAQREALAAGKDVDLSYDVPGFDLRYRINVFRERAGLAAVFRRIQQTVPPLDALGLPPVVKTFADFHHGLVLVGGPTGSGKSTTLAALIEDINHHSGRHVVTIEDPIEILYPQRESLINQREVGAHAESFASALKASLRQDPDVLLVGELRDRETIELAVNAAETGHLVFATVHTTSAATSLDRMIHAMPAARQPLIRSMLADSLRAVVCQQLLRRTDGNGKRVLACEVLLNTPAVRNLIRKDKSFQLPSVMVTHADVGMQLMDDHLQRLVESGVVDRQDAMLKALDKHAFAAFLEALDAGIDTGGAARVAATSPPPGAAQTVTQSGFVRHAGGGES